MRDKATVFESMEKARRSLPRPFALDPSRVAVGFAVALLALCWLALVRHRL